MRPRIVLPLLAVFALPVQASTLYKCVGADGRITYTNMKTHQKCEVISRDLPVSAFSPPPARPRQAAPADFPRVDGAQQRNRDSERRTILEQELATEQRNLELAKQQLAEQEYTVLPGERIVGGGIQGAKREERLKPLRDRIQLHERNVAAIRKEIGNIR